MSEAQNREQQGQVYTARVTFAWSDSSPEAAEEGIRMELDSLGIFGAEYTVEIEPARERKGSKA